MEQPSKPAAQEKHDARGHISRQPHRAVRRGAGRITSADTKHYCTNASRNYTTTWYSETLLLVLNKPITGCEVLPASVLFQAAKLQKNHAERQDTKLYGNKSTPPKCDKSRQVSKTKRALLWSVPKNRRWSRSGSAKRSKPSRLQPRHRSRQGNKQSVKPQPASTASNLRRMVQFSPAQQ